MEKMRKTFLPLVTALNQPVSCSALAAFRFCFGAVMFWEAYRFYDKGWIESYYIEPEIFFPFEVFSFLAPFPGQLMYLVFLIMALAAVGVAIGYFYRFSATMLFVSYSYVFLIDQTHFNNHYYLICLLSFMLIFVDAHRWASVDRLRKPKLDAPFVPTWHLWIFRAQIAIVFFYGGIAKFNPDWFAGEPMRMWLTEKAADGDIPQWMSAEPSVWFYIWAGLIFDLAIAPLLLWKRTRALAIFSVVLFNMNNAWMFQIGVFPVLMSAAMLLFIRPDAPMRFLNARDNLDLPKKLRFGRPQAALLGFAAVFILIQAVLPLRHYFIPGDASWTDEGQEFAWRMKLRDKSGKLVVTVINPKTGREWRHDPQADLSKRQYTQMRKRPDMIYDYVQHLSQQLQNRGLGEFEIRVSSWATLNGRPYQRMIDPGVDLSRAEDPLLGPASWILPLEVDLEKAVADSNAESGSEPTRVVELMPNVRRVHTGNPEN